MSSAEGRQPVVAREGLPVGTWRRAGRAHLLPTQDGWEEVADYALDWALANAGRTVAAGAVEPARP